MASKRILVDIRRLVGGDEALSGCRTEKEEVQKKDRRLLTEHFRNAYPDLVCADGSYVGRVSSFHGATYRGQTVCWDLNQPRYRFALYCLASAWSRSGRWEGPVRLTLAMRVASVDCCDKVVEALREVFGNRIGTSKEVATTKRRFVATLRRDGIQVNKLPGRGLLPWATFCAALVALKAGGGLAKKGNLQSGALGSTSAPLGSVEGTIAAGVYGKMPGQKGTRRITYVAALMDRAGVAENLHGILKLRPNFNR